MSWQTVGGRTVQGVIKAGLVFIFPNLFSINVGNRTGIREGACRLY